MSMEIPRPILKGKKALVIGIANEYSIAYGCAKAFRELGADLAVTYLNEKARPYVEPLARELPFVQEALASIAEGGYAEALARVACLLARKGEPLLLSRLQMKQDLMDEYGELLPALSPEQWRRNSGEQEIIVRYEPDKALATLPKLLAYQGDRDKLMKLVQRLLADDRVQRAKPSTEQLAMVEHIGETLEIEAAAPGRSPVGRKTNGKSAVKRGTGSRA